MKFEKNIFTYWHQGFENSPDIVKLGVRSLKRHNKNWNIHLLDAYSLDDWISPVPISHEKWQKLPLAHQSDIIRTQLLKNHGGVWADPTIYFTAPLDNWIGSAMKSGVFFFDRPGRDRIISNWFIASESNNYIIDILYKTLCEYWNKNDFKSVGFTSRKDVLVFSRLINRNILLPQLWLSPLLISLLRHAPYMIYHYTFAKLARTDRHFANIWQLTPSVSADGPHRLLRYGLHTPADENILNIVGNGSPPLFKLNWKTGKDSVSPGSLLDKLFRREYEC